MMNSAANFDTLAYLWLNRLQQRRSLITTFRTISHSGDGHLYAAIGLILFYSQTPDATLFVEAAVFAFFMEIPCFMLLKQLIKRDRPYVQLTNSNMAIKPSDKFSMPSGHAAAAFVMAFLIAHFYPESGSLAYSWATCIGISRVVLGVHYPSDVLAGAALGMSCSYLSLVVLL